MKRAILVVALAVGTPWGAQSAAPDPSSVDPLANVVVAPGSTVLQKTVAQWGEDWWQWLLAAPNVHDPALDQTGEKCQYGQQGPVWFLAGSYGGNSVIRQCTIPEGRYVLFPVANGLVKPPAANDVDCTYALDKVARGVDAIVGPYATVNGVAVRAMEKRRERTGRCFDPAHTGRKVSAAEGYWVMLAPPPRGRHVLKFGNSEEGPARKDVTVILTVADAGLKLAQYEPWPSTSQLGAEEVRRPQGKTFHRVKSGVVSMPVTPSFGSQAVVQRLSALVRRDGRYQIVKTSTMPLGAQAWIYLAPRDVASLDRQYQDFAARFRTPFSVWARAPERGQAVIFQTLEPTEDGPSAELRLGMQLDIQRLLYQALDKAVPVSDHEIADALKSRPISWQELVRHRPPPAAPTAAQRAQVEQTLKMLKELTASASEATHPHPGSVHLVPEAAGTARISADGMTVEYCCGGGYTEVKASRAYSYGRYYFEAELRVPGASQSDSTWTNLGVVYDDGIMQLGSGDGAAIPFGEHRPYRSGDVFGVAVDLDTRRLFLRVNGQWTKGSPEEKEVRGESIGEARKYTAAFSLQAPRDKKSPSEAWVVNFGRRPFRDPVPKGFTAYDR